MTKIDASRVQVVSRSHYGVRPQAFKHWADAHPVLRAAKSVSNEIQIYGLILPHEEVVFLQNCFDDSTAMSGKLFRERMEAIEGDVVLRINSDGGDVFEASVMLQTIRERQDEGFKVNAVVDGIAASAASLLACAADETTMGEMAFVMIHQAAGGMYGGADDMERGAKLLRDMNEAAAKLYAKRTGKEMADIETMMADETYLAAEDAVAQGFASAIVERPEAAESEEDKAKATMERRNTRLAAVLAAVTN